MAQFTVRNFDDKLFKKLKKRAAINHRSLEAEVRDTLTNAVKNTQNQAERKAAIAELKTFRRSYAKRVKIDAIALLQSDRHS